MEVAIGPKMAKNVSQPIRSDQLAIMCVGNVEYSLRDWHSAVCTLYIPFCGDFVLNSPEYLLQSPDPVGEP